MLEIRPAREDDRLPLAEVFAAVAEERDGIATEPPVDVEARAASWTLDGTLVAVADGEIVGSIHVDASRHGFGEIGMAVARAWRGRGVGSALLAAAIDDGARTRAAQAQPGRLRTQRGGDRALPQVRLRRGGPPRQAVPAAERRALGRDRHGAPAVNEEWLELSYGSFGAVEDAFHAVLEQSLEPRGPDVLYDLVGGVGLVAGMAAVDVGCGEGRHTGRLAERFGLVVTGVDPTPRN